MNSLLAFFCSSVLKRSVCLSGRKKSRVHWRAWLHRLRRPWLIQEPDLFRELRPAVSGEIKRGLRFYSKYIFIKIQIDLATLLFL